MAKIKFYFPIKNLKKIINGTLCNFFPSDGGFEKVFIFFDYFQLEHIFYFEKT